MKAWIKDNWLNLLSFIITSITAIYTYLSGWHILLIIILVITIIVIFIIVRRQRIKKYNKFVAQLLELDGPIINNRHFNKSELKIIHKILINIANGEDTLERQKKAISVLPQLSFDIRSSLSCLTGLLENKKTNVDIRRAAADALKDIDNPDTIEPLVKALNDPDGRVITAAAESLKEKPCEADELWALIKALFRNINSCPVSRKIMEVINNFCETMQVIEIIDVMKCLIDPGNDPHIIQDALKIIMRIGGLPAAQTLVKLQKRWEQFPEHSIYKSIQQGLNELGAKGLI